MRLSELTNEAALDALADILEPISTILTDEKVKETYKKRTKLQLASYVIKEHKKAVIEILARLDGKDPNGYICTIPSVIRDVLDFLNDPALTVLFPGQGQKTA